MRMFKQVIEIRSRAGVLHFKRWAIIECKWFNIYIHYIARSDMDKHPHNHPWNFTSVVLKGGYVEKRTKSLWALTQPVQYKYIEFALPYMIREMKGFHTYHKIRLLKPTYTLVFTGPRINDDWGYLVDGKHVVADEYRKRKNANSKS